MTGTITRTARTARAARLRRALLLAVLVAAATTIPAQVVSAAKFYDSTIGTQSASATGTPPTPAGTAYGATFGSGNGGVGDVAVNDPAITTDGAGQSGWVYVVDRGNNRIQAFDQNKSFQWAIGRDVIAPTVNEAQRVVVSLAGCSSACGQFKLKFGADTTTDLNFNATTAQVQAALRALPSVGAPGNANVLVTGSTGGPYVVAFVSGLAAANQGQIEAQPGTTPLVGSGSVNVETVVDGTAATPGNLGDVFEKCTVAGHCKAGSVGTPTDGPGGELNIAAGIDIDQATGHLFVRERDPNARVQQFTAAGAFVRAFGWNVVASGPGDTGGFETCNDAAGDVCQAATTGENLGTGNPGQFGSTTQNANGLAVAPPVAPNAGQLYVADPFNCRVQRFTVPAASTAPVTAGAPFGAGVASTTPAGPDQFCATTTSQRTWPRDVAADAQGVVYGTVAVTGVSQVKRFDTTADVFLNPITVEGGSNQLGDSGGGPTGIEVDHATDHVLLTRSSTSLGVVELDLTGKPDVVDPSHVAERHVRSLGATPLAVGAGGGRYFLSTNTAIAGTGTGVRVLVLDDDGTNPVPVATLQDPTNVGSTTATLSGHVDPVLTANFKTSYRWQVSKDGANWVDVTNNALVGGDGFTSASVVDNVTGLEPNTLYRVRVRTQRDPDAGLAFSAERLLLTDPAPPVIETRPAEQVDDVSARLVGSLNPGGLVTEYWFEWGDEGYGNRVPATAATATGSVPRLVGERLSQLSPDTFYHYRLCGQNAATVVPACGNDQLFRTAKALGSSPDGTRTYEMITAPNKVSRRGGDTSVPGYDFVRHTSGFPSTDGSRYLASYFAQPADLGAKHGFALGEVFETRYRTSPEGWLGDAIYNVAPFNTGSSIVTQNFPLVSGDLSTSMWSHQGLQLFDRDAVPGGTSTSIATRVFGDQGGPRGAGWYPWLDPTWLSGDIETNKALITSTYIFINALLDESGQRAISWYGGDQGDELRDLIPSDDTLAPKQLSPPQTTGKALFLSGPEQDWRPADLINECTGAGAAATLLPTRDGAGTIMGPSGTYTVPANYNLGSTTVTLTAGSTAVVGVGHTVSSSQPGIQPGTTMVSVDSPTSFTISLPTTAAYTSTTPPAILSGGQNVANAADDTLTTRPCALGSPTDTRGAAIRLSGNDPVGARLLGSNAMPMSEDGKRIFFLSPDPLVTEGQNACAVGDTVTGSGTRCPAQLFVRQFDDAGNPTVRWLSRPENALFEDGSGDPQMHPNALGAGVAFEGASRDGSVVYFRTNAPLLESDPNGADDRLAQASRNSWDLYRYDLGPDNNADPAPGDPGDRLTRISGGPAAEGAGDLTLGSPNIANVSVSAGAFAVGQTILGSGVPANTVVTDVGSGTLTLSNGATATSSGVELVGTADPNTNCSAVATSGADNGNCSGADTSAGPGGVALPNGTGGVVRHVSDDGSKVYFVTAAQIPGAANARPGGGATDPTTLGARINDTSRNLYLYDADKTGMDRYEFIARLPFVTSGLDACASRNGPVAGVQSLSGREEGRPVLRPGLKSCVHGSGSGDAIVFTTTGRLTPDDSDSAADVFVYDADADALTRLSSPGSEGSPYPCVLSAAGAVLSTCNGDLGFARERNIPTAYGPAHQRRWNVVQDADGNLTDVYFESRIPLGDSDENGPVSANEGGMDVYRWRRADDRLSLLSPGGAPASAYYAGNSVDGGDVFFWTEQRLSDWEIDDTDGDVYNATTRPPLPDPLPRPPTCAVLVGACQSDGSSPTSTPMETSSSRDGDAEAGPRATLALRRLSAVQRGKAARSGVVKLQVTSTRPGTITAIAKARIGKKTRRVGTASKRLSKQGAGTLSVRLTRLAREQLSKGRALRLSIQVSSPGLRSKSMGVVLRRAGK